MKAADLLFCLLDDEDRFHISGTGIATGRYGKGVGGGSAGGPKGL